MNSKNILLLVLLFVFAATGNWSCGAGTGVDFGSDEGANGAPGSQQPSGDVGSSAEPEEEMEFDFETAAASEHYVYIPVSVTDSVVRVDAESLQIRIIPVGINPKKIVTLAGQDVAVVLNTGSDDLTIITSSPEEDEVLTLDGLRGCNQLIASPDGRAVLAYYDDLKHLSGEEIGDFQTLLVLRFSESGVLDGDAVQVSIGFNPTKVAFDDSGDRAFVVTNDGISVLELNDLAQGNIAATTPVSTNPLEEPKDREVFITSDGEYAVVRDVANPEIRIVDIASGDLDTVLLPGLPTDLDLVPGSSLCLIMMREQSLAALIDLSDPTSEDSFKEIDISGTAAGAAVISENGELAVMYSTTAIQKSVAVMDLNDSDEAPMLYSVQKEIVGVSLSPDGSHALLLHEANQNDSDLDSVANSEGYTLLDLHSGYRKLLLTDSRWSRFSFVPDADGLDSKLFVLLPSDGSGSDHEVQAVDLETYLVERTRLHSVPDSLLLVPASRKMAINQDHPNGRISFLDVDLGGIETKTGFELNSLIH
jgi:DNA-binding beta-propeller fold protein YncE